MRVLLLYHGLCQVIDDILSAKLLALSVLWYCVAKNITRKIITLVAAIVLKLLLLLLLLLHDSKIVCLGRKMISSHV